MQERGYTLTGITKGLRPYSNTPVNKEELVECFNLIPRPEGLVSRPDINQNVFGATLDWPFPQVFIGHQHWLLCTRTGIYSLDGTLTPTLELTVTAGGTWHFADFFTYGVLTNGVVTVVYNTISGSWEVCDGVLVPTLTTVANFNGQIVGATENVFKWGRIGYASFIIDQSNVAGERPMPWSGEIYKILPLGVGLVIYGSNGIGLVRFKDTVPGLVKVLRYGIVSREAVGGDETLHTFIDTAGNLRQITEDFQVSGPLYQEFFSPMIGNEMVVSYNAQDGDFYICDGVSGYIKTAEGLGETNQLTSTIAILAGELIGVATLGTTTANVETDSMDFGVRSRKTIDITEVGYSGAGDVQVSIGYRVASSESFQYTEWVDVNAEGIVTLPIAGIEFKIRVKCSSYIGFKIHYITLRVKFDDNRANRGISNASKATA